MRIPPPISRASRGWEGWTLAKKIFGVYLAKQDAPDSEANVRLKLPASPWELHDAMDKVQLQENEDLYLEIDDYYGFEYDSHCSY